MMIDRPFRMTLLIAAAALALVLRPAPAAAASNEDPALPPAAPAGGDKDKADKRKKDDKKNKAGETKTDKKSERQFLNGYRYAYDLIFRQHDYAAAIAALHALGHDEHSDVATLIGYSSRKLGRYDEAKYWYDKALVVNPRNQHTLSYMGMWRAEQGNRLKAQDYLTKVREICGNTTCKAYAELKAVIAGTGTY